MLTVMVWAALLQDGPVPLNVPQDLDAIEAAEDREYDTEWSIKVGAFSTDPLAALYPRCTLLIAHKAAFQSFLHNTTFNLAPKFGLLFHLIHLKTFWL